MTEKPQRLIHEAGVGSVEGMACLRDEGCRHIPPNTKQRSLDLTPGEERAEYDWLVADWRLVKLVDPVDPSPETTPARSSHAAQVRGRTVPRNVDLTVPPGRHGPFRPDPPWRVVAAIQETIAAR